MTENITLSKVLVLDLLRRAAPDTYLTEREELLRTIVELRRELAKAKAALAAALDSMTKRKPLGTREIVLQQIRAVLEVCK